MFVNALKIAEKYTQPVIISKRLANGTVECSCATFIILNADGWILTSAHIFAEWHVYLKDREQVEEYDRNVAAITANTHLSLKQQRSQISKLRRNPNWITNYSFNWGGSNSIISRAEIDILADIAIAKLEPFEAGNIESYPTFGKMADDLPQGTSLCRLGFPFHAITASFDEATNSFNLAEGVFPMPRFPNDGILTRHVIHVDEASKSRARFIETSTPGLRGQSGGPVFDIYGSIWGLQSRTVHLPMGFAVQVQQGKTIIEEHQFLHVGLCTYSDTITQFLSAHGVSFATTNQSPNK